MAENFIKKAWENKADDLTHFQFQKFSKGEFKDKALISVSVSGNSYKISTTSEFANEFVRMVAEKLNDKRTKVSGMIVSTRDLSNEIEFKDKKQFMGVKQYVIEKEMTGKEIISICNKLPTSFIALSFKADDTELKIKAKAPKSAKPSTKGDAKPVPDFCKLTTTDKSIVKDMLFDIPENFKKVGISHDFIIKEIILPKGESDPVKIRELAKKKGKIIRRINVDEKESIKEKEFIA